MFNTLPCLEQIQKSAGLKTLEVLNSKFLVVSFPVKTSGRREKDMQKHYKTSFNKSIEKKNRNIQRLEFKSELVFIVAK
ncbi:MAG: hypothetical protein ACQXXE_06695 [Candidatus Bathyarchaeia archaeon]|nr:hypothetical protein [Candidatus Bathyarchaeota archaeon A05DMB-5]